MRNRISITVPITFLLFFLVITLTLVHYYQGAKTLQDTLWKNETSKADDINFIVGSLMERETVKISTLIVALQKNRDIINGIVQFTKPDGDADALKDAINSIFFDLDIDLFEVIDLEKKIIYPPQRMNAPIQSQEVQSLLTDVLDGERSMTLTEVPSRGWALESLAPVWNDDEICGAIILGKLINDEYAKKIAFSTDVQVSIAGKQGVIASSLPTEQRTLIDLNAVSKSITEAQTHWKKFPDERKVVHYAPIEIADEIFSLIVEIDTNPSFLLMEQNKMHTIKFSIIVLLIALTLGIGFTYYLVMPLKRLTVKAVDTVRDITGTERKSYKGNEIYSLVEAFNTMVTAITEHITQRKDAEDALRRHKEQLEDLVAERTVELQGSNEKLVKSLAELEQRANETRLMNQMGDMLQTCENEEESYGVISRFCKKLFPEDSGYLSILDNATKNLKVVTTWGQDVSENQEFEQTKCWAIRRGSIHFVENPEIDPMCPHITHSLQRSYICAPMNAQGDVLGMLHLLIQTKEGASPEEKKSDMMSKRMLFNSLVEHYTPSLGILRLREALRIQSIHDPLTGLYNRRHMEESLKREARRVERHGSSLGIIMCDVDHFKSFNDSHGHEVGDKVLRELGGLFHRSIRREDIACRYGGEEFMLILPEASLDSTKLRADELRDFIREKLEIKHGENIFKVTVSFGVAAFPQFGPSIEDTIKAADSALYQAKAQGRDRVCIATE